MIGNPETEFWDFVDSCNFNQTHDYRACRKQFYKRYRNKEDRDQMRNKFFAYELALFQKTPYCNDSYSDFVASVVAAGKDYYEKVMTYDKKQIDDLLENSEYWESFSYVFHNADKEDFGDDDYLLSPLVI